jgi:hypothetical protein
LQLPRSFNAKYSVIHQRLLTLAFNEKDWKICLENLTSALKPGGWLKMEELRVGVFIPDGLGPGSEKLKGFAMQIQQWSGMDMASIDHLDTWMEDAGLVDVQLERKPFPLGPGEVGKETRTMMRIGFGVLRRAALMSGE